MDHEHRYCGTLLTGPGSSRPGWGGERWGKAWDSFVAEMKSGSLETLEERKEDGLSHDKDTLQI